MMVDVVVYGPQGRHVLARTDLLANEWIDDIPPKIWEDISLGLFSEQLELVLHRTRHDAVAIHDLKLRPHPSVNYFFYECTKCDKTALISKDTVRAMWTGKRLIPGALADLEMTFGGCKVLVEVN